MSGIQHLPLGWSARKGYALADLLSALDAWATINSTASALGIPQAEISRALSDLSELIVARLWPEFMSS